MEKGVKYTTRRGNKIQWIIVHYPAAPGWSAMRLLSFYESSKTEHSAHYAVDQSSTICIVNTHFSANHCKTTGLKTFCGAKNTNSIGVDLCDEKINPKSRKVEDCDWYIPWRTISRGASLIAFLMKKYCIDLDHVVRHYDVTHKSCPRPFVGDDINEYYKMSGNDAWSMFKEMIKREYDNAK